MGELLSIKDQVEQRVKEQTPASGGPGDGIDSLVG